LGYSVLLICSIGADVVPEADDVSISSPNGEIKMYAWLTDIVVPGVVHVFHGWPEVNVNALISDTGLDPISGYPPFKSSLCEVGKI
jgi:anaerobic selenocysteine-containing dehydrogenase